MSAEAVRLPAAGALFWMEATLDGAGGRPIAGPAPRLGVTLSSSLPRGVRLQRDARGLVLLAPSPTLDHAPSEADRAAPFGMAPVALRGSVSALDGR